MAEEHDPKLSRHYRSLEPIEPPPALDQAILAAARRAADRPHAPLVAPAGRHRWYYGLAAAAVLMFAVALTLHMERERPDPEAAAEPAPQLRLERELRGVIKRAPEAESQPAAKSQAPAASADAERFAPDPQAGAREANRLADHATATAPQERSRVAQAPKPVPQATPASPPAPQAAPTDEMRSRPAPAQRAKVEAEAKAAARREANAGQEYAASAAAPSMNRVVTPAAPENPERWLERIAELRSRGKHAEADKELAEFRRVYPNYRLSEVMRERVEGR